MAQRITRVSDEEETTQLYLRLLRTERPRRSLLEREGMTREQIESALANLQQRGLLDARRHDVIDVFPPDTTLPAYAADLERQARAARSSIEMLTHLFYKSRSGDDAVQATQEVSLLDTVEDIESAMHRVAAKAESRIVRLVARSPRMDLAALRHAESIITGPRARAGRPLEQCVVFEQSILQVEGAFAALETMRTQGIDVRLTPHLAFSVLAVDRSSAIIDISHLEPTGGGSLLVKQPQLASALMDMCVGLYSLATPLPRTPRGLRLGRLSDRDGQILALLAAGASDQTISRQLTISQRTVERRVRAIMEDLGATTRFQAGAVAGRRGLV